MTLKSNSLTFAEVRDMLNDLWDLSNGDQVPYAEAKNLSAIMAEGLKGVSGYDADTITEIRAFTDYSNGLEMFCAANNITYVFNSTSTTADDGYLVLKPDDINIADPGRWIRFVYAPSSDPLTKVTLFDSSAGAAVEYSTISAALAAAAAGDTVLVGPGSWSESFTIPTNVTLKSLAGPNRTTIAGSAATGNRVTLSNGSVFQGFNITLPTDATSGIVDATTTTAFLSDIHFTGAGGTGIGMSKTGNAITYAQNIKYIAGDCATIFDLDAGQLFGVNITEQSQTGTITRFWDLDSAILILEGIYSSSTNLTEAMLVSASASVYGNDFQFTGTTGIHVDDGSAFVEIDRFVGYSGSTNQLVIDTGASAATVRITSSEMDGTKIDYTAPAANLFLDYVDTRSYDAQFVRHGNSAFGTPGDGKKTSLGEGATYTNGMTVFTSENMEVGPFVDVTSDLTSDSGSTVDIFPGVAVDNALFIGCLTPFYGIETTTTAAIALGAGSIEFQYWNGAAWTAVDVMATKKASAYNSYANTTFSNTQAENIRFGEISGWATKSVNGSALYWIAIRITGGITTSPTLEQLKLHSNHIQFNDEGWKELFGTARVTRNIQGRNLALDDTLNGVASNDKSMTISADIGVDRTGNSFNDAAKNGRAFSIEIPDGLDTSHDVHLQVRWYPDTANTGDVEFESDYTVITVGDTLDGSITNTHLATVETIAVASDEVLQEFTLDMSIPEALPSDELYFSLFRDAQVGNVDDTLAGNVVIVSARLYGTFWQD